MEARATKGSPNLIVFENIVLVLEHASLSPDSSLPRRLLNSFNAIVDFTFLADGVPSRLRHRAKRMLWMIVDPINADEFIVAAAQAAVRSLEQSQLDVIRHTVRVLAALLALLPLPKQGGKGAASVDVARTASIDEVAAPLAAKYAALVPADCAAEDIPWEILAAKVDIIDALAALFARRLEQRLGVSSIVVHLEDTTPRTAQGSQGPLLSLSLLSDVILAGPVLHGRINGSLQTRTPANANEQGQRQQAQQILAAADAAGQPWISASVPRDKVTHLGGGWAVLRSQVKRGVTQHRSGAVSKGKGKARAITPETDGDVVSASLIATLEAILPDLAADQPRLRRILRRPAFRNRSEEEVVQLLFEDQAEASESSQDEADDALAAPSKVEAPPAIGRRANIFDEQPLDASRLRWHTNDGRDTAAGESLSQPLPSSLKASILARVQMQNAAELEAAREGEGQEWNPFAEEEAALLGSSREVGFEEDLELESEQDRINRKVAVSNLGGERGNAREWTPRRDVGESESEEDGDDDARSEDDIEVRPGKEIPLVDLEGDAKSRSSARPAHLSFADFKAGCTSYLSFYQRPSGGSALGPGSYAHGWIWKEVAMVSGESSCRDLRHHADKDIPRNYFSQSCQLCRTSPAPLCSQEQHRRKTLQMFLHPKAM